MDFVLTYIFLKEQKLYLHLLMHKSENWHVWGVSKEFSRSSINVFIAIFIKRIRALGFTETIRIDCAVNSVIRNNSFCRSLEDSDSCKIFYSTDCVAYIADFNKAELKCFLKSAIGCNDNSIFFVNQILWNLKTTDAGSAGLLVETVDIDYFIKKFKDAKQLTDYTDFGEPVLSYMAHHDLLEHLFQQIVNEIDYHDYTIGLKAVRFFILIKSYTGFDSAKFTVFLQARTYFVQRKYEAAEPLFRKLTADLDRSDILYVEAYICLTKICQYRLDEDGAQLCIRRISSIYASKFKLTEIRHHLLRGNISLLKNDYKKALEYFNLVLNDAARDNDRINLYNANMRIGNIYYARHNYSYAVIYYEKAAELSSSLSYKLYFYANYSCFLCRLLMKQIEQAGFLLAKVEKVKLLLDDLFEKAKLYEGRAAMFLEKKYYARSVRLYLKAADVYAGLQLKNELINIYQHLSVLFERVDKLTKSLHYLCKAKELLDQSHKEDLRFYIYCQIGIIYLKKHQPQKSILIFSALTEYISANSHYYLGSIKFYTAEAYGQLKSAKSSGLAKMFFQEALEHFVVLNRINPSAIIDQQISIIKDKLNTFL